MPTSTLPGPRRTPARLPRRAPSPHARPLELLRGAAAALVLLAVLGGVPLALVHLVGNPLPASAPTRSWLDAELTASAVVDVLAAVLWLVWGHFAVCVAVELAAWTRGGTAARLRLGGASQVLAQRLVAAVLLLAAGAAWVPQSPAAPSVAAVAGTTAGPGRSAAPAAHGTEAGAARSAPAAQAPGAQGPTAQGPAASADAGWPAADPAPAAGGLVSYVVQPPHGRHHDCLWDIAERTLGDPLRYREVFELNRDRVQPDGSRLVDADLIRPGWVLLLPADAVGAGPAVPLLPAPAPAPVAAPAVPAAHAHAASSADAALPGPAAQQVPGAVARGALSGGLLLAGVLSALSGRTRGRGGDEVVEHVRLAADAPRARFLDTALRALAAGRAAAGLPLPEVVAAHLSADELVLHLGTRPEGAAAVPPAPWTVLEGGAWRVARADLPAAPPAGAPAGAPGGEGAAAPYPALVDVAGSGEHEVLVDLESAPGLIAVGGRAEAARDVVTSMAVELATNAWSDGVDVHLVGFGDQLSVLAPGNLTAHAALDALLELLEARHGRTGRGGDLLAGRLAREAGRPRPTVVAVSGRPAPAQVQRLVRLTAGGRTPVAVLCVGDVPEASWRFSVDDAGTLDLGVLGLRGTARRLPPEEYAPWLAALRAAV
ncbi:LysM peptidoglycan-binding domain-containing protein [Kineococcus sp. SYSU DK005]|uniref:LysM peptidoglycan-binding domain-containing protein n=1 Tax=Kineococcus sp. SYSU DK005 TaxID=3383126 RepID=UPI003D7E21B4